MPISIHEHPEDWLAASLADGLSPGEHRALDEHLAVCEPCRARRTDLAALDATLLREFPAAVGPATGFEGRLIAGFRGRCEGGGRFERLAALVGWLLRQRGMHVAGIAAVLLALVGIGQRLTVKHGSVPQRGIVAAVVRNDARIIDGAIDQKALENNKVAVTDFESAKSFPLSLGDKATRFNFEKEASRTSTSALGFTTTLSGTNTYTGATGRASGSPRGFAAGGEYRHGATVNPPGSPETSDQSKLTSDVDSGRDAMASFGDNRVAHGLPEKPSNLDNTTTLSGSGTYTGGTVVNAGTLQINGAVAGGYDVNGGSTAARGNFSGSLDGVGGTVSVPTSPVPAVTAPEISPAPTPAPDPRKLIRNAHAELEVASFDAAVDAVTTTAAQDGGFLDTRNSARGSNGKVGGTLVVKVLPERLDHFLAWLRTQGDLKNQTLQTEDVTKAYYDTDARLRNSRRMEERLLKMLDEVKGKMSEVLQVEKELGRVRSDIEQMQGELKLYDAQVRFATVTLNVYEKDLRQPAAFLLKETATLALLATDVEKAAAEVRRLADAAHAQVVRSDVSRDASGRSQANLRLLATPDSAAELIDHVKALGRVANFNVQDERVAQNGASPDTAGADSARVERAPVTFDITVSHDEQVSRRVSFTLVAGDVDGAFERARAAATAAGGEVVTSNLAHPPDGHDNATLAVRVPEAAATGLVAVFKTLGRAGEAQTQRTAEGGGVGNGDGPVLITLSVVDAEPAVQQTNVRIETGEVERSAGQIRSAAVAAGGTVESSNFSSAGDGRQGAELEFRLATSAYPAFIEQVRALGEVKDFTVQRQDRPGKGHAEADASAPVVVELTLYHEARIVAETAGLGATLRRTFGQGAGALMWSVQMIGVAVAFLAPWVVLVAAVSWGAWWWRKRAARINEDKVP